MRTLPDKPHIDQIRKRLWCGREFGQAAVMVGSGFSRNSERLSPSVPDFPLWGELAARMFDKLYPSEGQNGLEHERIKLRMTSGSGVLRLASEYEITFGRLAVDELLLSSIPDNQYLPGRLHQLLLSLPWSDVFTTNYDTLLERTRPAIHDRKYDVILSGADIPGRMKPRIVKLHGSFPSHRPFIFTEEDFRTYPADFAPFVNIVQQTIMENAFCLIGFSGDDPNFLHWSGWVRDHLGKSVAPIYLCGLHNQSQSLRKLLESRNIIPIDLSPVLENVDVREPQLRQALANEWFLQALKAGEPENNVQWPDPVRRAVWTSGYEMPPLIEESSQTEEIAMHPDLRLEHLERETLIRVMRCWQQKRERYPGWEILPLDNRDILWLYTDAWVEPILSSLGNLDPPDDIFLLTELNWRLEKTLTPIATEWVEQYIRVVDRYNPFPHVTNIDGAAVTPAVAEYGALPWGRLNECWVGLISALARKAREDFKEEDFQKWTSRLEPVVARHADWQARLCYEKCLFYLWRFDEEQLRKALESWPESRGSSFWEAKRAAILAELGDLKEAQRIAEAALNDIRSRQQPYTLDYSLFSQEGWVMALLNVISSHFLKQRQEITGQFYKRWAKLKTYDCNPWVELDALKPIVKSIGVDEEVPGEHVVETFDPGEARIHHLSTNITPFDRARPAFAFLRLYEEGALPMTAGHVNMSFGAASSAARHVESFALLWALSAIIRAREPKELDKWFDRTRVAALGSGEIEQLYDWLVGTINQAIRHLSVNHQEIIQGTSFQGSHTGLLSEVLSRISFRLSSEQRDRVFGLAVDLYKSPIVRRFAGMFDIPDKLFKRLLFAMPDAEILSRMEQLLTLPLPNENGFDTNFPQLLRDPLSHVRWSPTTRLPEGFNRDTWSAPIANLFTVVKYSNPHARKQAIVRLLSLAEIHALTEDELTALHEALWFKVGDDGFPADTNLYYSAILLYAPETKAVSVSEQLRRIFLSDTFPGSRDFFQECLNCTATHPKPEEHQSRHLIDWTGDEAQILLAKTIERWAQEKASLVAETSRGVRDRTKRRELLVWKLLNFLSLAILPRLKDAGTQTKKSVTDLLAELEQSGSNTLSAASMTLFIAPERVAEIGFLIKSEINSADEDRARDALTSLFRWQQQSHRRKLADPPADLLQEIVNKVLYRRQPGLDFAIHYLFMLVDDSPEMFSTSMIKSLCIGLEHLLRETELPRTHDQAEDNVSQLAVKQRPIYRALGAKLAAQIRKSYFNGEDAIPDVLSKWNEVRLNDPLPEVRKAWLD